MIGYGKAGDSFIVNVKIRISLYWHANANVVTDENIMGKWETADDKSDLICNVGMNPTSTKNGASTITRTWNLNVPLNNIDPNAEEFIARFTPILYIGVDHLAIDYPPLSRRA
jgi:hypothetical protein